MWLPLASTLRTGTTMADEQANLLRLTKAQLVEACSAIGLPTDGRKVSSRVLPNLQASPQSAPGPGPRAREQGRPAQ